MISVVNILVVIHRIRLDHDNVDKRVVLRTRKMFMERVRREEVLTSIAFLDVLSVDEHASPNEDSKY